LGRPGTLNLTGSPHLSHPAAKRQQITLAKVKTKRRICLLPVGFCVAREKVPRQGPTRLSALDQTIKIIGDEKKQPGAMIPIDIKEFGRSQGVGHRTTGNRNKQPIETRQLTTQYT
jgi:hypothetical protein